MQKNKRTIQINFLLNHFQRDENGEVETLFFIDEAGSSLSLKFDPKMDYSSGLSIIIEEARYRLLKGKFIASEACLEIISNATGTEISSEVDEEYTDNNNQTQSEFIQSSNELNLLFKLIFTKKSIDKITGKEVKILKYADSSENVVYLTEDEYKWILQREDEVKYIIFTISREDLQRDYRKTLERYPDSRTTNINARSIRVARTLESNEFNYRILDEIVEGQRAGDERYNNTNIIELYNSILAFRAEERKREQENLRNSSQQNHLEIEYGFTQTESTEELTDKKVDGRKAGAQKRWENIRNKDQKIQDLEFRIKQLEAELVKSISINTQLEGIILEQKKVLETLRAENSEYKKMEANYNKLKDIVDGDDPNYIISIHKIS